MKQKTFLILAIFFCIKFSNSQDKKVLFIGNSYTFIEDIPNIFYETANSTGDNLLVEAQTSGSATFEIHATSTDVINKINSDNWDFVVLQGQSVEVGLTGSYFDDNVAPFAQQLCETVRNNNACSQPVFYNTWGRQWGMSATGPTCTAYPWMCTYEGMDDELAQNYRILADTNDAVISPVGPVWRYIHDNLIPIELYIEDESHQSLAGAYASACTFYTTILRKDPTLITYNPGLSPVVAAQIRNAVKIVVYDQLSNWKVDEFDPIADFTFNENNGEVSFTNTSENAVTFAWDFGDTNTSTEENPIHTYTQIGDYDVELVVTKCGESHTYNSTVSVNALSLIDSEFSKMKLHPNPIENNLKVSGVNVETIKSIKLYNIIGNQLNVQIDKLNSNINMSQIASGTYFLKFKSFNGEIEILKVIKK